MFELHEPTTDIQTLPEPTDGPYLVPSKNGYMIHRNFHWGRILIPIKEAPTIAKLDSFIWPSIDLPAEIVGLAWSFFRAIYVRDATEAMVDITWDETHGYRLFVPPQTCSGASVKAKRNLDHYKGQIVGTIHSHCNFGAFHSGTDTHDADAHDGLHITLGYNMREQPEVAVMVTAKPERWNFKPESIWKEIPFIQHPKWWEGYVSKQTYTSKPAATTGKKKFGKTGQKPTSLIPGWIQDLKEGIRAPQSNNKSIVSYLDICTSLDEYMWRYEAILSQKDIKKLEVANKAIDEITQKLNEVGIDFDYELAPQTDHFEDDDILARKDLDRYLQ